MFCTRQPFGAVFQQFSGMHTATKTWERQLGSNWLVCAKHLTTPSIREEAAVRVYTLSMPFMATSIITPGMGKIKLLSFAIDEDLCGSVFLVISQRATIHTACSTCVTLSQKQLTRAQHGRSRLGLWMENIKVNWGRQMFTSHIGSGIPGSFSTVQVVIVQVTTTGLLLCTTNSSELGAPHSWLICMFVQTYR